MTARSVSSVCPDGFLATAEERRKSALAQLKKERNAKKCLANLIPFVIKCADSHATLQEICQAMCDVFGEYHPGAI